MTYIKNKIKKRIELNGYMSIEKCTGILIIVSMIFIMIVTLSDMGY